MLTNVWARLGPTEFTITGSLKKWSVVDKLGNITVPTIVTNGEYDEAQDKCVEPFVKGIKGSKWVKFSKSSHTAFYEEKDHYVQTISGFLFEKDV